MIWRLTLLELRRLALSPVAWVALALVALFSGFLLTASVDEFLRTQGRIQGPAPGVTDMLAERYLPLVGFLLMLITPTLTMRSLAEERRSGSLILLRAAPVSPRTIVVSKFAAVALLFLLQVVLCLLPVVFLAAGTELDTGRLAIAALGLYLMVSGFAAVGVAASAATREPVIAAMLGLGVLLVAWMLKAFAEAPIWGAEFMARLAPLSRLESFGRGLIDPAALVYFLAIILLALQVAVGRLHALRRDG